MKKLCVSGPASPASTPSDPNTLRWHVRAGNQYFPRHIRNAIPEKLNRSALSPRELDILRLIAKGLNNQGIAEALNITRGTVKWHVNIILRRLDVNDRTQAVIIAAQRGIIEI